MPIETVFIIILSTAAVMDRPAYIQDIKAEYVSHCIAEVKAAFDFENGDAEELVGKIEDCYKTDDN